MKVYLLQGTFFQNRQRLGISFESGETEAVVRTDRTCIQFAGAFCLAEDVISFEQHNGAMLDIFGQAAIDEVRLTENELLFEKRYADRDDCIHYSFKKEGDWWIGEYRGSAVGTGKARCIITEVNSEFFRPPT